jgi:MFS family permease
MDRYPGLRAFSGLPPLFWRLWLACLVNRLGTFVVPFLALYLGGERGLDAATVGLVVGAFGAGAMGGGPIGGALADRVGRRATIALGMVASVLALGLLLLAAGPLQLAAGALMLGLAHDLPRPAQSALLADLVPEADRPRAFGALYWAANLGFALASLLAGAAATASFTALFILDGATSLLCGAIVLVGLPETLPQPGAGARTSVWRDVATPFRDPAFVRFFLLSTMVALVFFQIQVAMPLDMRAHGLGHAVYGALIAINGAMIVVLQPFAGALLARIPRQRALALGSALTAVGFGLLGVGHDVAWYAAAIVTFTLGEIVMAPLNAVVVSELAPSRLRGTYQGGFALAISLAACVAPILGSAVLGAFGGEALWGGCLVLGLGAAAGHLLPSPEPARRCASIAR